MEIRFALIPPAQINAISATSAKKFARLGKHRFVVDNKNLFPHITLFKVDISKSKFPQLLEIVKTELKKFKPFNLELNGFDAPEGGWLGFRIQPSEQLHKLRAVLFQKVAQSNLVTKNVLKKSYRPHITLTRFYSSKITPMIKQEELAPNLKFKAINISLCLSRQTQVYKILNTVKLK